MRRSSSIGNSKSSDSNSNSNSGIISCEDCGNKAKRECEHRRCRSCCKTRNFECATHVKSTWVPVARRRLRRLHQQQQPLHLEPCSTTIDYHHYDHLPLSLATTTHFHHRVSTHGYEGGNFPPEVNSLAKFRCIRVSSEDNVLEQFAYQTSINIGGHVFKGILYDHGPIDGGGANGGDHSSSAGTSDNNQHHHHHHQFSITANTMATTQNSDGGGANLAYSSQVHSPFYSTPFNGLSSMQFFPHPRP